MSELRAVVGQRQTGKTTAMLDWLRGAPDGEHRVLVCHTSERAMQVYRDNRDEFESWQFVGINEVEPGAWSGVLFGRGGRVVLGLDDLDLTLGRWVGWPIGAISLTASPVSPKEPGLDAAWKRAATAMPEGWHDRLDEIASDLREKEAHRLAVNALSQPPVADLVAQVRQEMASHPNPTFVAGAEGALNALLRLTGIPVSDNECFTPTTQEPKP